MVRFSNCYRRLCNISACLLYFFTFFFFFLKQGGFTCDIESSMKLQMLKLVVNFSDRKSSYKGLLLTPIELRQALDGIYEHSPDCGVISKIISLLLLGRCDNISTVWMCACVEAFLRGADIRFHWWVTQSGLTEVCYYYCYY